MAGKFVLIILLTALLASPAPAAASVPENASKAVEYLKGRQNEDGGFSEPDAASDPRTTCWVILAASGAGENPREWSRSGKNPEEFLVATAPELSSAEDLALLVLAVSSAGGDPRNAAGVDLVSVLLSGVGEDGKLGADVRQHCLGVIALASAGETVPPECAQWLLGQQRADGGWGESEKVLAADTALAVEALVATREGIEERLERAMALLGERINPDGGFTGPAPGSDAQTTATVLRAINAVGQDPSSEEWSFEGNSPAAYLASLQAEDGHFRYAKGVESQPAVTTAMVVPALSQVSFPLGAMTADTVSRQGNPVTSAGEIGAGPEGDPDGGGDPGNGARAERGRAGAFGEAGGAPGLWVFAGICAAYLLILLAAVIVAGKMAEHARDRGVPGRTGDFPSPGSW